MTAFTLQEAQRHAGRSTRINCVSPGGIDTPLTPQFEALMGKAQSDWTNAQTGRAATPDEMGADEVADPPTCVTTWETTPVWAIWGLTRVQLTDPVGLSRGFDL